jgi:hypothetical protein
MRMPRIGLRTAAHLLLVAGLVAAGLFLLLRRDGVRAVHPPAAADRLPPGAETFVVFSLEPEEDADAPAWVAKAWEYVPSRPGDGLALRCELAEALGPAQPVPQAPELLMLQVYRLKSVDPTRSRDPLTAAVRRPLRDLGVNLYTIDYRSWDVRLRLKSDSVAVQSSEGGRICLKTGEGLQVHDRGDPPRIRPEPLVDSPGRLTADLPGHLVEYRASTGNADNSIDPELQACDVAHAFLGSHGRTSEVPGLGGRSSVAFSPDGRRFLLGANGGAEGNRFYHGDLEADTLREIPCPSEGLRHAEDLIIIRVRCP